jgi:hypothetical protein
MKVAFCHMQTSRGGTHTMYSYYNVPTTRAFVHAMTTRNGGHIYIHRTITQRKSHLQPQDPQVLANNYHDHHLGSLPATNGRTTSHTSSRPVQNPRTLRVRPINLSRTHILSLIHFIAKKHPTLPLSCQTHRRCQRAGRSRPRLLPCPPSRQ